MRITPLDVRKQEFRRSVRGFDCDEVRAFLTTLADEYETVLIDGKQLRERVLDMGEKINEYKHLERTLRDTLMTAERLTQDTRERANKEGDLIIQDARLQAKRILEECRIRTEELRSELTGLRKEKETYLARFKTLAETQIQFVECHRHDFDDVDKRMVGMVDEVIAGLGAKAAATAEAAVEHRETQPLPTPATAAFPATPAPEPAPEPAPGAEAYRAAPDGEVDEWRDYLSGTANRERAAPPVRVEESAATRPASLDETLPVDPVTSEADRAAEAEAPAPSPVEAVAAPAPETQQETVRPQIVVAPAPPPAPIEANPWQSASWQGDGGQSETKQTAPAVDASPASLGIPATPESRPDDTEESAETSTEESHSETTSVW